MLHNFLQQIGSRALGMVASVFTVSVTTRYLGPSSYGALTTAVMFVALWTSLTELGVGQVIVRRVMAHTGDLERLIRINTGMSVAYCLPLSAITAISGALIYRNDTDIVVMVLIVSVSLLLTTISSCFTPIFLITARFGAIALSDLLSRCASLGVTMLLVHFHAGIVWFAIVQLVPPAVVLIIQGAAATRMINWLPQFSLRESVALVREALPLTAMLIIGVLYWRADGVILSLLSTTDQVGIYGLAYTLTFTLTALSAFFLSSTLSTMVHLFAQDPSGYARFTARSMESMLFAGGVIAVVGIILANPIVDLVGSTEFIADGGVTVALLSVAVALTFVTGLLSQAMFAAHEQSFLARLSFVNLLINIALNVALIPHYGAIGAGVAMVLTEISGVVVASWRLSHRTPYRTPWLFIARLLIPLTICGVVTEFVQHLPVLLAIAVGVLVYLAVNLVIGPVDAKAIKSLFAKHPDEEQSDDETERNARQAR
ncbi:flippase [Mycobacterium sp. 141]|uniref:flippase n=1 Tax=Mycobacterium sp. 141 TaxID=1120797 RepID=UPI00037E194B|nr:flippase [Mycobacterium sp. 141]